MCCGPRLTPWPVFFCVVGCRCTAFSCSWCGRPQVVDVHVDVSACLQSWWALGGGRVHQGCQNTCQFSFFLVVRSHYAVSTQALVCFVMLACVYMYMHQTRPSKCTNSLRTTLNTDQAAKRSTLADKSRTWLLSPSESSVSSSAARTNLSAGRKRPCAICHSWMTSIASLKTS